MKNNQLIQQLYKRNIISGSRDGKIRIHDIIENNLVKKIDAHQDIVTSISLSNTESILISGSADHSICVWDTGSWKCTKTLLKHGETVSLIQFSPSNSYFVSGSNDGFIKFWDF